MRNRLILVAILAVLLPLGGCSSCKTVGPQPGETAPVPKNELYQVDLSTPEGPMMQILRAAQENDIELFKASFAPSVDMSKFADKLFSMFRRQVLIGKVSPVPESLQKTGDTEAVVKLRNARGKEFPLTVQKFGDKWLITKYEIGDKARERWRQKRPNDPFPLDGGAAPAKQ